MTRPPGEIAAPVRPSGPKDPAALRRPESMREAGRDTARDTGRDTYRHGHLREALIAAGVALAREGGPSAVALREATRRAGVVPNAAYRHFAGHGELMAAVRAEAVSAVARAIETELAALPGLPPRAGKAQRQDDARARLRAVGVGYVGFAMREPGLFRTAFLRIDGVPEAPRADKAGASGLNPYELLGAALDAMAESGVLAPERRVGAEPLAWSAVHGLAVLALDGMLGPASPPRIARLCGRVIDMVERGL